MSAPEQAGQADEPFATATAWYARWRSGALSPGARKELAAWLMASPHNLEAWRRLEDTWAAIEPLRSDPSMLTMRETANRRSQGAQRKRTWTTVGVAASLA